MNKRTEKYNKRGLYNGYDKKHKERDALDYYSTPTEEVINILNELKLDFSNMIILEPCCGGGHMYKAIYDYITADNYAGTIIATDVADRETIIDFPRLVGPEYDFLNDDYNPGVGFIDYIIMNPPYSTIEPFVMKALGMANKGILLLARLQFLEGAGRYENILEEFPPSDVYIYVDRIRCCKNGDPNDNAPSAQAYAWFYWDLSEEKPVPRLHWIRRADKR